MQPGSKGKRIGTGNNVMKRGITIRILTLVFALALQTAAWSQTSLEWYFDNTHFLVSPSDQVVLSATVTNTSLQPVALTFWGATFAGDLQSRYSLTWVLNLPVQIVSAHGTVPFILGTLAPIGSFVPPGTYHADPAWIYFEPNIPQYSANSFQIEVVPEPSVWALLTGGVLITSFIRRTRSS